MRPSKHFIWHHVNDDSTWVGVGEDTYGRFQKFSFSSSLV
jgi:hypothetical protein